MVAVRPATPDDERGLRHVDTLTWSSRVSPAPVPPEDRDFFERIPPQDCLVAHEADDPARVLGYVLVHQSLDIPAHAHVLVLNGLAVAPEAQGRGVGEVLVRAARAEARRRGARKLTLRVLGHNAGARRLYERCGFVVEGVLVDEFHLDDAYVDDVLMACALEA